VVARDLGAAQSRGGSYRNSYVGMFNAGEGLGVTDTGMDRYKRLNSAAVPRRLVRFLRYFRHSDNSRRRPIKTLHARAETLAAERSAAADPAVGDNGRTQKSRSTKFSAKSTQQALPRKRRSSRFDGSGGCARRTVDGSHLP